MAPTRDVDYDAVVIGAGFGGIRSLWELLQCGLTVKCFEGGSDVGGVWYWNRYPGARTDSEAWVYTMNFDPGAKEEWDYRTRYPGQEEVGQYLGRVVDRFELRKHMQFNTRVLSAHFDEEYDEWTITTNDGSSTTCRFFVPATGPLSTIKAPPFPGLKSFKGEWYQSASWPKDKVTFAGKRIAVIGTGATGVQIIPKIAPVAKQLTVFQRTPNFVLPGRNHDIDENQAAEIKQQYESVWYQAKNHPFGLAMTPSGKGAGDCQNSAEVGQLLDGGWECGGFHFQFETFDDVFTNKESNDIASEYLRQKIRAVVRDPETAELLCPKYPFLTKRPPCGHFYYEAFNRSNVQLVDISSDSIDLYENGVVTGSGEYEFDMVIFALGFDAGTGALSEIDVKGPQGMSLKELWTSKVDTFAGTLIPGFPNMFSVCGPHVPFGNMPVVVDIQLGWIGKTIRFMRQNSFSKIDVKKEAADAWNAHLREVFSGLLTSKDSETHGAWFVGANMPDKPTDILFYFGGVPTWSSWLQSEVKSSWVNMKFSPRRASKRASRGGGKLAPSL
ncbi:hypothetical protein CLIM01_14061 [Colletotrichum limetticola]|uniref:Cyclohexanone monooxygenase n=1 Tax=Colletotrichum limetticola TaxID=1209924 RepID=A0ABQ9P932_9PEZI|nr:hypothetical protein CLIM01_14061 [Colletotrichum limetticola]